MRRYSRKYSFDEQVCIALGNSERAGGPVAKCDCGLRTEGVRGEQRETDPRDKVRFAPKYQEIESICY